MKSSVDSTALVTNSLRGSLQSTLASSSSRLSLNTRYIYNTFDSTFDRTFNDTSPNSPRSALPGRAYSFTMLFDTGLAARFYTSATSTSPTAMTNTKTHGSVSDRLCLASSNPGSIQVRSSLEVESENERKMTRNCFTSSLRVNGRGCAKRSN
jgi:hypothetical protein